MQTIVLMPILVYCTKTTLPYCAKRTTRKANLNKSLVIIRLAIGNKKVYNDKRNRRKEKASGGQTVCRVAMQQKEEEKMTFYVKLNAIDDVYRLVETLLAFNGEVDMTSGRYTVDGRSILGIFSLDLRKPVKVTLRKGQGEDVDKGTEALMEKLKPFLCDPE